MELIKFWKLYFQNTFHFDTSNIYVDLTLNLPSPLVDKHRHFGNPLKCGIFQFFVSYFVDFPIRILWDWKYILLSHYLSPVAGRCQHVCFQGNKWLNLIPCNNKNCSPILQLEEKMVGWCHGWGNEVLSL